MTSPLFFHIYLINPYSLAYLSTTLLKSIINDIAPILSHIIFNKYLLTGIVPSLLKIAKVNPIYKSGDKTIVSYIDKYQYCHQSRKSWKRSCTIGSLILLLIMALSVLTNMVLDLKRPHIWPSMTFTVKLQRI